MPRQPENSLRHRRTVPLLLVTLWVAAIQLGASLAVSATTWTALGPAGNVVCVAAHDPQVVYASLLDSGVWKTTDGGETWVQVSVGVPPAGRTWIAADPSNSLIVYAAASDARVYRTVTGGASWLPASVPFPRALNMRITISRSNPNWLLVVSGGALFVSRDASSSWQPVGAGLPDGVSQAEFSPATSDTILVAVSDPSAGLFQSLDGGASWSRLPLPISPPPVRHYLGPIAFDPQNTRVIFAGETHCLGFTCFDSVFKSGDGAASWAYAGLSTSAITAISVDTTSAITVGSLAEAPLINVYRSTDGSLSWLPFADGLGSNGIAWFSRADDRLFAATPQGVFVAVVGPAPTLFHSVFPCRIADTRDPIGPYGGPALDPSVDRTFVIRGRCEIPATARSVATNLTLTYSYAPGALRVYTRGNVPPAASVVNWNARQTRANNATLGLGASGEIVTHLDQPAGVAHLIIDVTGYFE